MAGEDTHVDFLSRLPPELTTPILGDMAIADIGSSSRVCRAWNEIVRESPVWREICRRQGYLTGERHQPLDVAYYRYLCRHLAARLKRLSLNTDVCTFGDVIKDDQVTCFHQSGRRVVSGTTGGTVKVQELGGRLEAVLDTEARVEALRVDGDVVVVAGEDGTLVRWSVRTGLRVAEYRGHRGFYPTGIQIEACQDLLAASFVDYYVRVWRLTSAHLVHAIDVGTPVVQFRLCTYTDAPPDDDFIVPESRVLYPVSRYPRTRPLASAPRRPPSPCDKAYFLVINTGNDVSTYKFDPRTHALLGETLEEVESGTDCYTRQVFSLEARGGAIYLLVQQTEFGVPGAQWGCRANRLVYDIAGRGRGVCFWRDRWDSYTYPLYGCGNDACNYGYLGCGGRYDVLCCSTWDGRGVSWRDTVTVYRKDWNVPALRGGRDAQSDRREATLVAEVTLKHGDRCTPSVMSGPDVTWLDGLDGRNDRGLLCSATYRGAVEGQKVLCMDAYTWTSSTLLPDYVQQM